MPMAKTRRGRLRQIELWLRLEFPTPYPVRVSVERLPRWGDTSRHGRRIHVRISDRLTWYWAIEILCHEWAHAAVWRHESIERRGGPHHDDEWALKYAAIYRAYEEGGGAEASRKLSAKPYR